MKRIDFKNTSISPIRPSNYNDRLDTELNEINTISNDRILRASLADTVNFSGR